MQANDIPVEPGAAVEARDGRLGTVDDVVVRPGTGELAYVVIRRGWSGEQLTIPADLIESIPSRREVRLRVTRDEARRQADGAAHDTFLAHAHGGELRIPIVEERLVPVKRQVDLGELRIHKHVDHVEEVIRQPLTRDDLIVERVSVNEPLEAAPEPHYEGEWLVIPIVEEVLVVQKRLMLTEEIRIRKRQITEEQEIREVTRHTRLELEDATAYGIRGLNAATTMHLNTDQLGADADQAPPLSPADYLTERLYLPDDERR